MIKTIPPTPNPPKSVDRTIKLEMTVREFISLVCGYNAISVEEIRKYADSYCLQITTLSINTSELLLLAKRLQAGEEE